MKQPCGVKGFRKKTGATVRSLEIHGHKGRGKVILFDGGVWTNWVQSKDASDKSPVQSEPDLPWPVVSESLCVSVCVLSFLISPAAV